MTMTCTNCNAVINPDDMFCGECGAPVEPASKPEPQAAAPEEATQAISSSESSDPPPLSSADKSSGMSVQKMTIIALGAAAVLAAVFLFTQIPSKEKYSPRTSPVTTLPARNIPPKVSSRPVPKAPSTAAPVPSGSTSVNAYIDFARNANRTSGIDKIAPHQLTVSSCGACAPFMIYCTSKITSVSDLRGKLVRVVNTESEQLVQRVGGNPQLLGFKQIRGALQTGIIQCSISGGAVPK